jgi:hypothetical protein
MQYKHSYRGHEIWTTAELAIVESGGTRRQFYAAGYIDHAPLLLCEFWRVVTANHETQEFIQESDALAAALRAAKAKIDEKIAQEGRS